MIRMIRDWWRPLGFYWQSYIFMAIAIGCVIALVEGLAEPLILDVLERRCHLNSETAETILWVAGVLLPTLAFGFLLTRMAMRKMAGMVEMAKRLAKGDLSARMETTGSDRDVFNQMAVVFNDMAESVEGLLAHERRLLADISHELRSPLARMGVAVELANMKDAPEERHRAAALIEDEIGRMNELVGMLLAHARKRLDDSDRHSRVDFSGLVAESARAESFLAASKGVSIDSRVAPGIFVMGQPVRLRTIVDNILDNAVFYSPAGGAVSVRLERSGDRVLLSVRDSGAGVPEKHLRDIFRAFFRVDESRARTSGGAGLGLALARDAAVSMGGDITARNAGPGLEVTATLPYSIAVKLSIECLDNVPLAYHDAVLISFTGKFHA